MSNDLSDMLNKSSQGQNNLNQGLNMNNPIELMNKFNEFKKGLNGKDPMAMLNSLMNSGKFNQAQLQQAKQMANMFKGFIK